MSTKKITMTYDEYQADLVDAETKAMSRAFNEVLKAINLSNKGDKSGAYEVLAECLDYQHNTAIEKLLNYEAPSFNDSDVPF